MRSCFPVGKPFAAMRSLLTRRSDSSGTNFVAGFEVPPGWPDGPRLKQRAVSGADRVGEALHQPHPLLHGVRIQMTRFSLNGSERA